MLRGRRCSVSESFTEVRLRGLQLVVDCMRVPMSVREVEQCLLLIFTLGSAFMNCSRPSGPRLPDRDH